MKREDASGKCIYKCIRCHNTQVDADELPEWQCLRCGQYYKMQVLAPEDKEWTCGIPIGAEDWLVEE